MGRATLPRSHSRPLGGGSAGASPSQTGSGWWAQPTLRPATSRGLVILPREHRQVGEDTGACAGLAVDRQGASKFVLAATRS